MVPDLRPDDGFPCSIFGVRLEHLLTSEEHSSNEPSILSVLGSFASLPGKPYGRPSEIGMGKRETEVLIPRDNRGGLPLSLRTFTKLEVGECNTGQSTCRCNVRSELPLFEEIHSWFD